MIVPKNLKILAIVPARGGSRGIPLKNLAPFHGRPLIDYTLDCLCEIPEINNVIVSSDSATILEYCSQRGFTTDYVRPTSLSTDDAPVVPALLDAYQWAQQTWREDFSHILMLQPTSPKRKAFHVRDFLRHLSDDASRPLVSVSPLPQHPMECISIDSLGQTWDYLVQPPRDKYGRQHYSGTYAFINGALYAATPQFLSDHETFLEPPLTAFYFMDHSYSLDIDTPEDLRG